MLKRAICIITLITMILSCSAVCLPAMAASQITVWDGSETQPTADSDSDGYIDITLPSQLAWVVANNGNSGGKYELLNDIWLNDITVDTVNGTYTNNMTSDPISWYTCPVGSGGGSATFNGTVAGNGHTVHGLFYDDDTVETDKTSPGLIPFPKNATITDLKIDDSYVVKTGGSTVAAFCGRTHQITVNMLRCVVGSNVYIKGPSGVAGFAGGGGKNSYVTITDCVSLATVTGTAKAAGIIGDVWNAIGWKVNNTYTTSSVAVGTSKVLSNSGNIYSVNGCKNSTALTLEKMTGASAIENMAFDFDTVWMTTEGYPMPRAFFDGEIIMNSSLAGTDISIGIDFKFAGVDTAPDSMGLIINGEEYQMTDAYTFEAEADAIYNVTPFVRYLGTKHYGEAETVCASVLANIEYRTADDIRRAELDESFKDSVIYKSGIWQTDGVVEKQPTADADGDGYIDITEASELAWVVANDGKSGKYELLNDITLNEITVDTGAGSYESTLGLELHPWYVKSTSSFTGTLKGNGHIVRGIFYDDDTLYFNEGTRGAGGLIPYPKNAVISGIGVEASYLKIHSNYSVGAIAGCVHGNTVKLTVDECYAGDSVYVNAYTAPGGILGGGGAKTSGYVKINNCYSLAALSFSKEYHGGIIGNNWSPKNYSITNCYALGPVVSNMGNASLYTAFENVYTTGTDNYGKATTVTQGEMQGYDARITMPGLDFDSTWMTTDAYPTLKIFAPELRGADFGITDYDLDITDGIAFKLSLDGKICDGVTYGIEINGESVEIENITGEYTFNADADGVYTVKAFSEYDGQRVYDKEYTLCAAVSANCQYALADDDKKAALDSAFAGSQLYKNNDSITFSLFADFHYVQDGYMSTIADINAILKRANDNNAAFVLSAGDFCNNYAGSPELFKAYHENEYGIPTYNIYGNHELQTSGNSMVNVTPLLTSGDNVVWGTEDGSIGDGSIGYYYFDNGGFRVVAIDTQYSFDPQTNEWEHNKSASTSPESDNIYTEALGPVQLAWLEEVLMDAADKDIPCIVIGHDGMSGLFATSSSDAEAVRGIFKKANAKNEGTVLMCINGHLHTNHNGYNDGVFYLDTNTVRNCLWSSGGTAHYEDGQTFMYENYDDEGNLIEIVEKNLTEVSGSTKTWYSKDPLNAIVTVTKDGVITVDGVESEWIYGVEPSTSVVGVEPRITSGTYFDCDKSGHIYEVTAEDEGVQTLTCKNSLCGHTVTREVVTTEPVDPTYRPDEHMPFVTLNDDGNAVVLDHNKSWATRVYWGCIGDEFVEYKWFDEDFRLLCGTDYFADYSPKAGETYNFTKPGWYRFVLKAIRTGTTVEDYTYSELVFDFYYDGTNAPTVPTIEELGDNQIKVNCNGAPVKKFYYGNIGEKNVPYSWFNDFWGTALGTKTYTPVFDNRDERIITLQTKGYYNIVIVLDDGTEYIYTTYAENNAPVIKKADNTAVVDIDILSGNVGTKATMTKLYYGYLGTEDALISTWDEFTANVPNRVVNSNVAQGTTYNLANKGYYKFYAVIVLSNGRTVELVNTVENN